MAKHYGFVQGGFMAVGSILKDAFECDFSEAYYKVVEDGKAIHLFGWLSDEEVNEALEITTKDDSDKWQAFEGKALRLELPIELIEKDYNGKKSKKEPTLQSAFIANQIKAKIKEGEPFKIYLNLGAPSSYVENIASGKTAKGKEIPQDMLTEFAEQLLVVEPIEALEHLKDLDPGQSKGYSKARVNQQQIIREKVAGVAELISSEDSVKQLEEIILWAGAEPNPETALRVVLALLS